MTHFFLQLEMNTCIYCRTTYIVPEAEYPAGALIDVFQYLGSLKHGIWKRMERAVDRRKYTSSVVLLQETQS